MAKHRFRIRFRGEEIPLPVGEFRIGRSPDSDLLVDDAHVSRRHALIRVYEDHLTIEDASSRNGVLLNGDPIARATRLRHADWVMVGSYVIAVIETQDNVQDLRRTMRAPRPSTPARHVSVRPPPSPTRPAQPARAAAPPLATTDSGSFYEVLLRAGREGLVRGNISQAEGNLSNLLLLLRARMQRGEQPTRVTLSAMMELALGLAAYQKQGGWITQALEVMSMLPHVLEATQLQRASELSGLPGAPNQITWQGYVNAIWGSPHTLSDPEQQLVGQIEQLL